ncbi:MAG TPA: threonine/serine dehydratase [Rhizomicrobium sp.]
MPNLPSADDVEAAAARIAPFIFRTPLLESAELNARTGARIFLKPESLQRTGSFKIRGAMNRLLMIPQADQARGVVAFSSGNHAQGVAAAAAALKMHATIVMPADAPRAKLEGTRALGAQIVTYDRHREDREAIAQRICDERGATLVRPFDDAGVVAGQGTVGLEIAQDAAGLDLVAVPCSGGGLVSGVALAMSKASSRPRVVSVEPLGFDGMRLSVEGGKRIAAPATGISMADSLMAPMPGKIPFDVAREMGLRGVSVTDAELARAVSFAFRRLKLAVEPGGSAALAALLAGKLEGRRIAIVLSGGNCDPETVARCCDEWPEP